MSDWTPVYTRAWNGTPGLTGLIDAIGTNDGADAYVNPHDSEKVLASQSSNIDSRRHAFKAFDHSNSTNNEACTANTANSWWQVDFKTNRIILAHIGILNRASGGNHPRHFKVQGSNDGSVWTDLLTVTDLTPSDNSWWDSAIESEETWTFIRIQQTGTNSSGSNPLVLGEVEFWGEVLEYTGPQTTMVGHAAARVLREQGGMPVRVGHAAIRALRTLYTPPPPARPDEWGEQPTDDLDWWAIAHQQGGVEPVRKVTVELPGGDPVELEMTSGSVKKQLGTGYAYTAKIDAVPNAGVWKLVSTPGAIFRITFGWRFGPKESQVVTRGMGVYLLAEVPEYTRAGSIGLNLVDLWKRVEDSRFPAPWTAATGQTRATAIAGLIFNAQTRLAGNAAISATGGDIDREFTVERERTEAVTTLARDGRIRAHFDGNGSLRVDPDPVLAPERAVATFKDGDGATILGLSREVEFTRLYNAVIVNPITDSEPIQSWEPVTVQISDPDHPRHPSKIGLVPGFFSSPSLTTRHAAMAAGITRLQSIMQELETVSIETWARPDIEPADTISTVETATYASEHRFSSWLVTESEFDLIGLGTKISGRSTALGEIEEGDNEDD